MPKIKFPEGFREGQSVSTPHGDVVVGRDRAAELSDKQHEHLRSTGLALEDAGEVDLTRHEHASELDLARAATLAYQHPAIPPSEEYEKAANAREIAGKLAHAHQSDIVHHATLSATAHAENLERKDDPDSVTLTQAELHTHGSAPKAAAQSAALRELIRRRRFIDDVAKKSDEHVAERARKERADRDREAPEIS